MQKVNFRKERIRFLGMMSLTRIPGNDIIDGIPSNDIIDEYPQMQSSGEAQTALLAQRPYSAFLLQKLTYDYFYIFF